MADTDSPKFKIRFDDDGTLDIKAPEPPLQEKVENLRLKKLSRRINLIAVLVPFLLVLMLAFGYFDILKKFDNDHISGSSDIQTLSKDLDSKFSSLSVRQAKIEALLNEKISAMEKTAARLQQNLEKTEKTLSGVQSAAPGKDEIAGIIAGLEKTLASVHTDINRLASEIKKISTEAKSLQDKLDRETGKLTTAVGTLQKEIGALKSDTAALASARVDKKTFDLTTRHQERFFQQKLDDLGKSLSEKTDELRNQIKALEDRQKKSAPLGTVPPAPPPPLPLGNIKPATPEPGKIIEQEIKR